MHIPNYTHTYVPIYVYMDTCVNAYRDPESLPDFIASICAADAAALQGVLEEADLLERLERSFGLRISLSLSLSVCVCVCLSVCLCLCLSLSLSLSIYIYICLRVYVCVFVFELCLIYNHMNVYL